ncbi:hypothetical protein RCH14_001717 [Massilia sp. MP_M2]|uniref:hypothetical protein n=1 Tax=Massilia sp. MP_M2 TaxID=3071713 RepID=UPI00319E59B1
MTSTNHHQFSNGAVKPIAQLSQIFTILTICTLSFVLIFFLTSHLPPTRFHIGLDNVWFDADVPRYLCQIVDRYANDHWRNKVHPLFSFLSYPIPNLLTILQIDLGIAVRIQVALIPAVGMGFLFSALKRIGLMRLDALLLTGIALTSSSSLVWFAILESYAYTFTAFSIVLYLAARDANQEKVTLTHWVTGAVLAFSVTITNLIVALFTALQSQGIRRTMRIAILAVAVVGTLSVMQRMIFPSSGLFFLPASVQGEATFFVSLSVERIRQVLSILYLGSVVMPDFTQQVMNGGEIVLSVQQASWRQAGVIGLTALGLTATLLLTGIATIAMAYKSRLQAPHDGAFFARATGQDALRLSVTGSVTFLTVLHIIYGQETFVYVGSVLPFLLILLGYGTLAISRHSRAGATVLLVSLLLSGGYHNFAHWKTAVAEISALNAPPSGKALIRKTCSFVKQF